MKSIGSSTLRPSKGHDRATHTFSGNLVLDYIYQRSNAHFLFNCWKRNFGADIFLRSVQANAGARDSWHIRTVSLWSTSCRAFHLFPTPRNVCFTGWTSWKHPCSRIDIRKRFLEVHLYLKPSIRSTKFRLMWTEVDIPKERCQLWVCTLAGKRANTIWKNSVKYDTKVLERRIYVFVSNNIRWRSKNRQSVIESLTPSSAL